MPPASPPVMGWRPVTLKLKVLSSIADVDARAWDGVVGASGQGDEPVMRWSWIHALEASGSATRDSGWEPHHLTLWRGGELVGCAPAYRKFHSMGEYVYDFGWAHAAQSMGLSYYPKL